MSKKITSQCKFCSNSYESYEYDNKQYCSKVCYYESGRKLTICNNCGSEFKSAKHENKRYCNKKCWNSSYEIKQHAIDVMGGTNQSLKAKLKRVQTRRENRNYEWSLTSKKKLSISNSKPRSELGKANITLANRLNKIKYLEGRYIRILNGAQSWPNYNIKACEYFNHLMIETVTNIQHAENGGEFKVLGYFVDGYDKENNIVYEWDEPRHFNINGTLKDKDIKRQKEIETKLNCKFIRIKG